MLFPLFLFSSPLVQSKKVALITGANKGIGKEIARQLLVLGDYQVFIGSRDELRGQEAVEDLRAAGLTDVHLLVLDVTSDDSVKHAAELLASQVPALDVLVNNAGVSLAGVRTALTETLDEFKYTYEANVFGPVRVTNAFIPLLKQSKHGRIVNLSSGLGAFSVTTDANSKWYPVEALSYNSSKSALNQITVSYAKALKEFGIKVNAANPGYTITDMNGGQGDQTVEFGAHASVFLATLPDDGPTGSFYDKDGVHAW